MSTLRSLATEDGPSGNTVRLAETADVTRLIVRRRCFRRAGRTGSTSAKMAGATTLLTSKIRPFAEKFAAGLSASQPAAVNIEHGAVEIIGIG